MDRRIAAAACLLCLLVGVAGGEEPEGEAAGFEKTVPAVRIRYRDPLDHPIELEGILEHEDETRLQVRSQGCVQEILRSRVLTVVEIEIDVRRVYSPEQLMDQLYEAMRADENVDFDDLTADDHWRIASRAEWVGALEVAQTHYAACAADATCLRREAARQRLARLADVMALLRDQAALQTLRDARVKLRMSLFRESREILDGFAEKHPEVGEGVTERLDDLRAEFVQRRTTWLQRVAARRFVRLLQDAIRDKVREKDVAITDVTGWTRRELPDQAFLTLADAMGRHDDVTPEEARSLWEGRPKRRAKRVTYGCGSYIVDPAPVARGTAPPPATRGGRRPPPSSAPSGPWRSSSSRAACSRSSAASCGPARSAGGADGARRPCRADGRSGPSVPAAGAVGTSWSCPTGSGGAREVPPAASCRTLGVPRTRPAVKTSRHIPPALVLILVGGLLAVAGDTPAIRPPGPATLAELDEALTKATERTERLLDRRPAGIVASRTSSGTSPTRSRTSATAVATPTPTSCSRS